MTLKEVLGLRRGFRSDVHEAMLSVYFTGQRVAKRARGFFSEYGITEVQYNVLNLLDGQPSRGNGLTQAELSSMMLVDRSNMTGVIDRMEKAGLVERRDVPGDRRCHAIRMTPHGKKLYKRVDGKYMNEIASVMGALDNRELKSLISVLEKVRGRLGRKTV